MTTRIDDQVSAKFQAAAMNFNSCIKVLFGEKYSLDAEQAFSIQFAGISERAAKELLAESELPENIRSFVLQFESGLSQQEYDDPGFSYRVAFVRKTANTKTAADKVVQMVPADSDTAAAINQVFLRETEKTKYRPGTIVKQMKAEGFTRFGMKHHTDLWKDRDARNSNSSSAHMLRVIGSGMRPGSVRSKSTVLRTPPHTCPWRPQASATTFDPSRTFL
jgi:hypothetical protein